MTAKLNRTCVLVVGMHRSGTSALSRVLGLLGCSHPKNHAGPDSRNQTGYWEPIPINNLNDEILESAGTSWDDWSASPRNWFESVVSEGFAERAIEVFNEEYGDSKLTVLKDPRICRLLPFWLSVLKKAGFKTPILIPIRNPKEVAASLSKREGTDLLYNELLWLRHVLEAEFYSRGAKRAFLTYDDLLENHSAVITATEDGLGIKWPRRSIRTTEEIDQYLSEQYRHQRSSSRVGLNDPLTSDWLARTYEILLRWARSGEDTSDFSQLDSILLELNLASERFGRLVYRGKAAMHNLGVTQSQLIEKDTIVQSMTQLALSQSEESAVQLALGATKVSELEAEVATLRNELQNALTQHNLTREELEKVAQARAQEVVDLQELVQSSSTEVTGLREQLLSAESQLHVINGQLSSEAAAHTKTVLDLQEELSLLQTVFEQAKNDFEIERTERVHNLEETAAQLKGAQQVVHAKDLELASYLLKAADLQEELSLLQTIFEQAKGDFEIERTERAHDLEKMASQLNEAQEVIQSIELESSTNLKAALDLRAEISLLDTKYEQSKRASEIEQEGRLKELSSLTTKYEQSKRASEVEREESLNNHARLVQGFKDTFQLAEQDNEELNQKLREAEASLHGLEQERRNQMFEMNQLRSSLAQKSAEADDYHFEVKRTKAEKSELRAAIVELEERINLLSAYGGKLTVQINDIVKSMNVQNSIPLLPKRLTRARTSKVFKAAGVVNSEWYLHNNPDVSALGIDATLHYVSHGADEGRAPNAEYEALKSNKDVA